MPLTYSLNPGNTSYSLVYNSCVAGHAQIPSIYNGLPVTSIGLGAFYACQNLTSVTIPNSITHIGDSAFYSTNLNQINVPESITNLPFEFCLACGNLTGVSLPNSLTGIGASAFGATALTNITIPQNVTNIGSSAFGGAPLNNIYFLGNMPNFSNDIFLNVNSNMKINRIPGKNWNTYFIQGRPVELFYPENYVIKNQIRTGGLGKITLVQKVKYDPDATIYINKIEVADGQILEENVKVAINNFVVGCKADGNWNAIESCCIFAGARTLNGSLVPLKGPNLSNNGFTASDYNRTTGLKGDGTTKYLNTNYFFNSNQSEDIHASIVFTERSGGVERAALGVRNAFASSTLAMIFQSTTNSLTFGANSTILSSSFGTAILENKLFGFKRDPSNGFLISTFGSDGAIDVAFSTSPISVDTSNSVLAFATRSNTTGGITALYNGRIFFYSVGRNIDLQKLNNRTKLLMDSLKFSIIPDPDALAYINNVELADGQALEFDVKVAINSFIVGCKTDGIWNAIQSSCILAGARTLAGALVPLKGIAPTNFNFMSSDYNRATGLKGDGSSKYLNSNRTDNADPQNNQHLAVYSTSNSSSIPPNEIRFYIGTEDVCATSASNTSIGALDATTQGYWAGVHRSRNTASLTATINFTKLGFYGISRNNSNNYTRFGPNGLSTVTQASSNSSSFNIFVFAANLRLFCSQAPTAQKFMDQRLAFYSIGEGLNLSLLNNRITTLMSAYSTLT